MKFPVYCYLLIGLVFLLPVVVLLRQSAKDNAEPVRTIPVKLVMKRSEVIPSRRALSYRLYSILFLTEEDEILEFHMNTKFDWDMLNEGDLGNLTYQGSRYIKFERTHINPPK